MKNHIKTANGMILQTNKKWLHLKQNQKEWIANLCRTMYVEYGKNKNRLLDKNDKNAVLNVIYTKIEEHGIWKPDYEVRKYFNSKINRYNKILADMLNKTSEECHNSSEENRSN